MSLFNNGINNGLLADDINIQPTEQERLTAAYAQLNARGVMDQVQQTINKNAPKVSQTPTVITNPTQDQQNWMEIEAAGGYEAVKNDPTYNYEARQKATLDATNIELAMEEEAYGAPRQKGWKWGDTYTRLSSLFGANVASEGRLVGSPSTWKEFGNQLTTVFEEFGYKVDQNRFFPAPIYLDEGGEGMTLTEEGQVLEKNRLANTFMNRQLGWNTVDLNKTYGMTIRSADQFHKSIGDPNTPPLGDNAYAGISRRAVLESLGRVIPAAAPTFKEHYIPPTRSTPWHEYGHILDNWAADGQTLSAIAMTLDLPTASPHRDLTAHDYYVAWMNDPRTAKLDVVDKINTADHPNQKLNNPREILGKLFATARVNPTRSDGEPFDPVPPHSNNMQENIARAIGKFFNPDQTQDEGHIQGIKDMRRDVIGAIANLLNQ